MWLTNRIFENTTPSLFSVLDKNFEGQTQNLPFLNTFPPQLFLSLLCIENLSKIRKNTKHGMQTTVRNWENVNAKTAKKRCRIPPGDEVRCRILPGTEGRWEYSEELGKDAEHFKELGKEAEYCQERLRKEAKYCQKLRKECIKLPGTGKRGRILFETCKTERRKVAKYQGWEFTTFALLLKIAHIQERLWVICSCRSLNKSDHKSIA